MRSEPKNNRTKNGHDANGRFNGVPGPGRKPGVPNRTTAVLKEAILIAAANVGDRWAQAQIMKALNDDGELIEANGGLVGYLEVIASSDPKAFMPLLGKVLPLVLQGSVDVNLIEKAQQEAEHFTRQIERLAGRMN
jgi:hypothetical protein